MVPGTPSLAALPCTRAEHVWYNCLMIRGAVITALTLAAAGTALLWCLSYRVDKSSAACRISMKTPDQAFCQWRWLPDLPVRSDFSTQGWGARIGSEEGRSMFALAHRGRLHLALADACRPEDFGPPMVAKMLGPFYVGHYVMAPLFEIFSSGPQTPAQMRRARQWERSGYALIATCSGPLWLLGAILMSYPAVTLIRGPLRRWHRRRHNCCVRCGYNLTGNISGVCPECGTPTDRPLECGVHSFA